MPPLLASFAASDAFVKQMLLPQFRHVAPAPQVVGVPSVNNRMYRNEPKPTELSVWSHRAIACCVFVQPPLYSMALVWAFVESRSTTSA